MPDFKTMFTLTSMSLPKFTMHILLIVFGLFVTQFGYSQEALVHRPLVYEHKEIWFDEIVTRENTELINGPEYFISFQGGATHPFFGSLELTNNQLWYDQQFYANVHLLYDIYTDMLVVRYKDKKNLFAMIELDQNKVEGFTLDSHHFRKMNGPKLYGKDKGHGYVDILYEGKNIILVAMRRKSTLENKETRRVEYQLDDHYYFISGTKWAQNIFELTKKNKKEIKAFISSNKIKVRKKNENDLKALAHFCDTLATDSP